MERDLPVATTAIEASVETCQRTGRILVPLLIAAAVTGLGVFVFFELVTAVLLSV
ncbi:hypothetical protein OB955_22285 [Halobacteria archaeon AArc-m2/3/4]|uniref:Uncharacterized protein n=1 Tax=Natronoglomus mannanivorans TaxID=2979990 RepID=A0AAP2YZY0_9EURY|nr:hypothetical protein [Halobacteria archaeon AArc-xg1-1]MCU4975424.1 hypothetical protein [Halobacteria archaeon AArc-m2/3/4]